MNSRVSGFTLLEAIVALSIFSSVSVALYSWYSTTLFGLIRAEEQLQVVEFIKNVDARLSVLNLQEEQSGEVTQNDLVARWNAQLIEPVADNRNPGGQMGYFAVGLYQVDISIFRLSDETLIDTFTTRMTGYEGVRVPNSGL